MQIGPTLPVLPTPTNKAAADEATNQKQISQKQADQRELAKPAPFDPNPALRPTIQDRIDVNRTLLLLHKV